jgi:hypothetical protein
VYASGYQTNRASSTVALGQYVPSANVWIVLTTDNSYKDYYTIRMFGKGDIESGNGSTLPTFIDQATASRILTPTELKSGYTASDAKSLSDRSQMYPHAAEPLESHNAPHEIQFALVLNCSISIGSIVARLREGSR